MKYHIFNIEYDYDDESPLHDEDRPTELFFEIDDYLLDAGDFNPAEDFADLISDETTFCIFGCEFEEISS